MQDSMVTARMSSTKKEAGGRILKELGYSASQAVNELYDYLLSNGQLPWQEGQGSAGNVSAEQLQEALEWVDGLRVELSPEFAAMSIKDARRHRLASSIDAQGRA